MAPSVDAQMDMDVMTKCMDAKVIHWSVVGDYEGEDLILNVGTSGYAPVKDHVEIDFDYTIEGNGGLVGSPTFTDCQRRWASCATAPKAIAHLQYPASMSIRR